MISSDILKQIKRIQIFTNRKVNEVFAGEYESSFKGRGMQFDEVREYIPGDDIRTIDWNVTARTGRPHIKRFVEERELTVIIMVDLSASCEFGTFSKRKSELAAELAAVLAFSAIKNGDKIGLITFSDRIELFIPPKKGAQHVLRFIRELLYHQPPHRQTDMPLALNYLAKVIRKHATVFLLSDFFLPQLSLRNYAPGEFADARQAQAFRHTLRLINKRHDLIAMILRDRRELDLPAAGLLRLEDAETGQIRLLDTASARFRSRYQQAAAAYDAQLQTLLRSVAVDTIHLQTDKPYFNELVKFFKKREKRR